jgi:hypothetical protein
MNQWTNQETQFLQRFYKRTSNNLIARVLGRSRSSVNHKALDMGLRKIESHSDAFYSRSGNRSSVSRVSRYLN